MISIGNTYLVLSPEPDLSRLCLGDPERERARLGLDLLLDRRRLLSFDRLFLRERERRRRDLERDFFLKQRDS